MPDLETRLHEEFDRPSPSARRSTADLLASTRRIRRRRHTWQGAGVFVAVVAVVTATVAVRPGVHTADPAHPSPSVSPTDSIMPRLYQSLKALGRVAQAQFVDAGHGFIRVTSCTSPRPGTCTTRLIVTTDGGATIEDRTLPGDPPAAGDTLIAFDAEHLLVDSTLVLDPTRTPGRWISADGGRTWTKAPTRPGAAVDTIPAGDFVYTPIGSGNGYDAASLPKLEAVGPDGVRHTLRHSPPGGSAFPAQLDLSGIREIGGSWFLVHMGDGPVMLRSRDDGASWQPVTFDPPVGVPITILGGDSTAIYADVQGVDPAHRVRVSHDGGTRWSTLRLPPIRPGVDPEDVDLAVAGHRVMVSDGRTLWVSDGGPFTRVDEDVTTMLVEPAGTGVIGYRGTPDDPRVYYSADGRTWTRMPI
jgi:hypothetical protein